MPISQSFGAQAKFDGCMKEKLNMDRPPYGYFNMIRVHETSRPPVEDERPSWLDDPRGQGRPDALPKDFPKSKFTGAISDTFNK